MLTTLSLEMLSWDPAVIRAAAACLKHELTEPEETVMCEEMHSRPLQETRFTRLPNSAMLRTI